MGSKPRRRLLPKTENNQGREWDRGTELLTLFAMTAHGILHVGTEPGDARPRPQSLILVGPPGIGKTEMLLRFRGNSTLAFRSDMTVRGLWKLLQYAEKGRVSHVVMTEFQKTFQRKLSTAVNCIGTLAEAMDEGVFEADVGAMHWSFNGARIAVLAGMTGRGLKRRQGMLFEMGFLDRCAMLPWELPDDQRRDVMYRISHGDRRDLARVVLPVPEKPIAVRM